MITWDFFRPRNFAVLALVILLWMFLLSAAKSRLDGATGNPNT